MTAEPDSKALMHCGKCGTPLVQGGYEFINGTAYDRWFCAGATPDAEYHGLRVRTIRQLS